MNVVCATDDNFVQHCTIMLTSLLINNTDVNIFLLTEGLKPQNELIIKQQVEKLKGALEIYLVDTSIIEKFPMPKDTNLSHISRATYYRLLIPEILPKNVDKVIYLDCDIIVNQSIQDLWNLDLRGYALAAAPQIGSGYEAERLGYPIKYGYFNAGVNVINMDYWRKKNVAKKLIGYIAANYKQIKYHDQDALNAVLYNHTFHLLPMWNMTSLVYSYFLSHRGDKKDGKIVNSYELEKKNANKYKENPIIVHVVSKPKPWQKGCVHPLSSLYYDYAKKTLAFNMIKQESKSALYINRARYWLQCHFSYIKQVFISTDKTRL